MNFNKDISSPMWFGRENPGSLLADTVWILLGLLQASVLTCHELTSRRQHLSLDIDGSADTVDFSSINADAIVAYLSEHKDELEETLARGNAAIHRLAWFGDRMPGFIARPSLALYLLSAFGFLVFFQRYTSQYRQWRYNRRIMYMVFVFAIVAFVAVHKDLDMTLFAMCPWIVVGTAALSVTIHRMLGERAWRTEVKQIYQDAEFGEGDNGITKAKNVG